MPEVSGSPPSPRTPLVWDGTRYRAVRGHTDGAVQVRGEDQLRSYAAPLARRAEGVISGAGGFIDATSPGDGYVWHVTHAAARDLTSPTTAITLGGFIQTAWVGIESVVRAIPATEWVAYKLDVWLEHDDFLQATFAGALAADTVTLDLVGHAFTKET